MKKKMMMMKMRRAKKLGDKELLFNKSMTQGEEEYYNVTWKKYLNYLREWADNHAEVEFYGMTPACFNEWDENENSEEDDNDNNDEEEGASI